MIRRRLFVRFYLPLVFHRSANSFLTRFSARRRFVDFTTAEIPLNGSEIIHAIACRTYGKIGARTYLKKAVEQEPEMMIELLVEKVYVYSDDRIEIMLHYVDTPITPKPIEYDKDESPEGESLRGSLIYTTKIFVDNDIFKGMNKKILEPTFKETQKMPVLIEIRG